MEVRQEEVERRRIVRVRRWRRGMFRSLVWVARRIGRRVRRVVEIVWVARGSYVSGCLVYMGEREGYRWGPSFGFRKGLCRGLLYQEI